MKQSEEIKRHRRIPVVLAITLLGILTIVAGCSKGHVDSDLERLNREAKSAMRHFNSEQTDSLGNLLLENANLIGDRAHAAWAHFYLSYYRSGLGENIRSKKLKHLDEAERIAQDLDNDTLLTYIYNQKGVWALAEMQTQTAQYWFNRSIETGKHLNDRSFTIPAEMNLSEAMRILGDTMGIQYDRDLFRYAQKNNLPQPLFAAAIHCASHYASIVTDTAALSPYIRVIRTMEDTYPGIADLIYARFYLSRGNFAEAEKYAGLSNRQDDTHFLVLYGEILNRQKKYEESESWLSRAYSKTSDMSPDDRKKLLALRAENMHLTGNDREAWQRQKEYRAYCDSLDKTRTYDLVKRYRTEYEVVAKDREIAEQKSYIRNLKWKVFGILFFLIISGAAVAYWIYRRNRFYKDIVRQNRDFIEREKLLNERISLRDATISELNKSLGDRPNIQEKGTKISEIKTNEIFDRILSLVEKEEVWRDVNITRDSLADMAGCNRTYLTDVLKAKTGMGYSQFMNGYRIREAVRRLSDPSDETPLKNLSEELGFITIQTFYSSFKKDIGMSPAAFRKSVREL